MALSDLFRDLQVRRSVPSRCSKGSRKAPGRWQQLPLAPRSNSTLLVVITGSQLLRLLSRMKPTFYRDGSPPLFHLVYVQPFTVLLHNAPSDLSVVQRAPEPGLTKLSPLGFPHKQSRESSCSVPDSAVARLSTWSLSLQQVHRKIVGRH